MSLDYAMLARVLQAGPTPLFATVSGAHLYGFESPDSDVDLRGAYVLPLRQVLGLQAPADTTTITREVDSIQVDWVAHDLSKFVRMMTERNGYVLEQLYSPLVVHGGPWHDELRGLGRSCVIRPLYHHYRGFYWNQRRLLERHEPTVKQLLYAYRVVLSGIHVLLTGSIEAHLPTLRDVYDQPELTALIERKQQGPEHGTLEPHELAVHQARLEDLAERLDQAHDASRLPEEPANMSELEDYVVRARLSLGQDG